MAARDALAAVLLAAATVALFWPSLGGAFLNYDDELYVAKNLDLQRAFAASFWRWLAGGVVVGNWHPLTMLSHALDWRLYGADPWGHHLSSVILHAAAVAAAYLFLARATARRTASWIAAALFGWHPLRVESVAWIAERKDVLAALFWMLALLAYLGWTRRPSRLRYAVVAATLALGLLAKPMLVTLPFVLVLVDRWPLGRLETLVPAGRVQLAGLGRRLGEKWPLLALAAISSLVTYVVQQQSGAMQTGEALPLDLRLANSVVAYVRYLGKLFWPVGLAVFYPHPRFELGSPPVVGSACLLAAITLAAARLERLAPCLLVGWLWFLGTLVPTIGLVQVGRQALADRYSYLPSLGVIMAVVWGAAAVAERRQRLKPVCLAGAAAALAALALLTWRQERVWKSSESLFAHALEVTENNSVAHTNLGWALAVGGRFSEAEAQFRRAAELEPASPNAQAGLGTALEGLGRIAEAIAIYRRALELSPQNAELANNLAWILATHPDPAIRRPQEAVELARQACDAQPSPQPMLLDTLAAALAACGQYEAAVEAADRALDLIPAENTDTQTIRAHRALFAAGKPLIETPRGPAGVPSPTSAGH